MAESNTLQPGTSSTTVTETPTPERSPVVRLKLKKPKNDKKVQWQQGTVDNEHMNKKKSKCCCIYEKPRMFGESSSEDSDDDDECGHCRGHGPKDFKQLPGDPAPDSGGGASTSAVGS